MQSRGGRENPPGLEARRWPSWSAGRGWDRPGRGQWERPRRLLGGGQSVGGGFLQENLWVFGFMCHLNNMGWYILVWVSVFCKLKEVDLSCSGWWA